ncbi:MAG: oligosaccharide flippase family protein [Verrucomicrobiales bacterium]|nr:oligosaccharide flippase family protein [Verrucomicrobiales bacterium]
MRPLQGWLLLVRSRLLRSAAVYTATSFLNAAAPFLLLPILTRFLSEADYGRVAMFQTLVSVAVLLTGVSIDGSIARQYYEKDGKEMAVYVGNCFGILVVSSALVLSAVLLAGGPLSRLVELPQRVLWLTVLVAAGRFVCNVNLVLWQVQNQPWRYARFQILISVTTLVLAFVFVVPLGLGWLGAIYANLTGAALPALFGIWRMSRDKLLSWRFSANDWRVALVFGGPLVPHSLGGLAIGMSDRVLITHLVGIAEAGVYVVGAQIGMVVNLLQSSFNTAWLPWLFERLKRGREEDRRRIVQVTYVYFGIILLAAAVVAGASPLVFRWAIGPRFSGAIGYVPWIAMGYAFNGMYKMVTNYIFYAQKTWILAVITLGVGLFNIVVTIVLIQSNGAVGAAQGLMVSFLLSFLLTWRTSASVYRMPWRFAYLTSSK